MIVMAWREMGRVEERVPGLPKSSGRHFPTPRATPGCRTAHWREAISRFAEVESVAQRSVAHLAKVANELAHRVRESLSQQTLPVSASMAERLGQ